MITIECALGLDELLVSAEPLVAGWGLRHPLLGELTSVEHIVRASKSGSWDDRDGVLRGLARLADKDAGDCREAAGVLCSLLVPGVVNKLMKQNPASKLLNQDALNRVAASELWFACRTFPWESELRVAPNIVWSVRRSTLASFGVGEAGRLDRTWANVILFGSFLEVAVERWGVPNRLGDPVEDPGELGRFLAWARSEGLVTDAEIDLLLALANAASDDESRRTGAEGLMSVQASEAVGQRLGMSGRTVRRRASRCLSVLSEAVTRQRFWASSAA